MSRYDGRREYLQRTGRPTYRLCRYADDMVLLVHGTKQQAQALLDQLAAASAGTRPEAQGREDQAHPHRRGLRVSRAADHPPPKAPKRYVYTFVSNEALASIRRKVKALTGRSTTNMELSELLAALNRVLRGWANYFRHAAAKRTFNYLGYYAWWRVGRWLRKKHPRLTWKQINRRYTQGRQFPRQRDLAPEPRQHQRYALPLPGRTRSRPRGPSTTLIPAAPAHAAGATQEQLVLERVQQALA